MTTSALIKGRKPRLLVLTSTYPRWKGDPEPGFVHQLCTHLASTFEVHVVCPAAPGAVRDEILDGVFIHRFRYAPQRYETLVNNGGMTTNLRRSLWKYLLVPPFVAAMVWATIRFVRTFRPDVAHIHWVIPQGVVALIAGWFCRFPPFVLTSHGADIYAWNARLLAWLKSRVISKASAMTVVSRAMQADVAHLCRDGRTPKVVPMGVDLHDRFTPDPSTARSAVIILFVGRIVEKKGLRHLIDAMPQILSRVPNARLVIAGFGPEEAERKKQVQALGIEHATEFLGAVPQESLPTLYRRATVFVAPFVEAAGGDREGLGLVAVEAAGCGCPVVVSELAAISDVFEESEAVFVPPGAPEALAESILSVLQDPASAPRPCRELLMRRFDWSAVSGRYATILGHVCMQEN